MLAIVEIWRQKVEEERRGPAHEECWPWTGRCDATVYGCNGVILVGDVTDSRLVARVTRRNMADR